MLTILWFIIDQIRTTGKKPKMIPTWTKCVSSQRPCMNKIFHFILYIVNTFLCLVWNCSNIPPNQQTNNQLFNYYFFLFLFCFFIHVYVFSVFRFCFLFKWKFFFIEIKRWNILLNLLLIYFGIVLSGSFLWMLTLSTLTSIFYVFFRSSCHLSINQILNLIG